MGVWKDQSGGEGTKDNVPELDTARGNSVTQSEVVFTQEVWEIVKNDQEQAKNAAIELPFGLPQISFLQER